MFASRKYIEKFGMPQNVSELKNHRLIGSSERSCEYCDLDWHLKLARGSNASIQQPYLRVSQPYAAIQNNIGIASLSKENKYLKNNNALIQILKDTESPKGNAFLIYSEQLRHSKPVKVFAEFIIDMIKKENI